MDLETKWENVEADALEEVSVVRRISHQTLEDWSGDKCIEDHAECKLSGSGLCVYGIRKTIMCNYERAQQGTCPWSDKCHFKHS